MINRTRLTGATTFTMSVYDCAMDDAGPTDDRFCRPWRRFGACLLTRRRRAQIEAVTGNSLRRDADY